MKQVGVELEVLTNRSQSSVRAFSRCSHTWHTLSPGLQSLYTIPYALCTQKQTKQTKYLSFCARDMYGIQCIKISRLRSVDG